MSNAATALGADPAPASTAPSPAPAPAPSPSGGWLDSIQNQQTRDWVQAKGWADPAGLAESAYNLEKLIGHEKAGRTLVVPGENATPEEIQNFRNKLGVPDSPDKYMDHLKPDDASKEFAQRAATWFQKHGVPPKEAAGIWSEFQADQTAQAEAAETAWAQQTEREFADTLKSWGGQADANVELSKRFARQFVPGTAEERQATLDKIERAIGTKTMLEMFANAGKGLRESPYIDAGGGGGFGMSAGEARAKIESLKGDAAWSQAWLSGDKTKIAEMNRLTGIAYPS